MTVRGGGGGGISDNNCNNEVMSKEDPNIYDMSMNYHNFVHVQSELDVYPECCTDVSYHDFSDVHCCQADGCTFKNSVGAGCQYFDHRCNSRHMGDAGSRAEVLHNLNHAQAIYGEVNDSVSYLTGRLWK